MQFAQKPSQDLTEDEFIEKLKRRARFVERESFVVWILLVCGSLHAIAAILDSNAFGSSSYRRVPWLLFAALVNSCAFEDASLFREVLLRFRSIKVGEISESELRHSYFGNILVRWISSILIGIWALVELMYWCRSR